MIARKWTLASLAGLALLASSVFAQGPSKPAAVVNGEPISVAEVEATLKQVPLMQNQPTEAQSRQMRAEVIGQLVDDLLMQQFLRKNGPKIDSTEINKLMSSMDSWLKTQGQTKQEYCRYTGQSEAQMRAKLVQMLQWGAYVKQNIPPSGLKRYYDENRDYFDQIAVQASHIMLRVPPSGSEVERQAAKVKLQAIRQDIVANKIDFAEAAKKYSQCESAPRGGDLGYFPRKFVMDEALARAAFALKIGEISDVVQSDYGLHLIKAINRRRDGDPSTFERVEKEVRETAATELYFALLDQERKTSRIEAGTDTEKVSAKAKP